VFELSLNQKRRKRNKFFYNNFPLIQAAFLIDITIIAKELFFLKDSVTKEAAITMKPL
jgi:hypothetical protein